MISILLLQVLNNYRISSRLNSRHKTKVHRLTVNILNLYTLYFLKLLNTALYLVAFGRLIAEAFYKGFCRLYAFLLVKIGTLLLFQTLLSELDIMRIVGAIIIDFAQLNLNSTLSRSIHEGSIVGNQNQRAITLIDKSLQPPNRFNIKMVSRFV